MHKPSSKKTRARVQGAILVLLVGLIILLGALAPSLLLQWKDRFQIGRFVPLDTAAGTLAGTTAYRYADILCAQPWIKTSEKMIENKEEAQAYTTKTVMPQLMILEKSGVLPLNVLSYSQKYIDSFENTFRIITYEDDYHLENVYIANHDIGFVFDATFDTSSGVMLTLNIHLPYEYAGMRVEENAVFLQNYIEWLQMADVDDWQFKEHINIDGSVYTEAVSVSLGITLAVAQKDLAFAFYSPQ